MKKYESDLKKLIEASNGGCDLVHQADAAAGEAGLRFLSAKSLISLLPAGDGEFWIRIEHPGLVYFDDKRERRITWFTEHFLHFVGGFASGILVTVAAQFLIA